MADFRDLCERCVVKPACEKACLVAALWEFHESSCELGQAILREMRLSWRVIKTMFDKEA